MEIFIIRVNDTLLHFYKTKAINCVTAAIMTAHIGEVLHKN